MESHENIQEYVIEKRNELAKELYDFFGTQKGEMFHYIDDRVQKLSQELYDFITSQKREVLDAMYLQMENINRQIVEVSRKKEQDFLHISDFFKRTLGSNVPKIILFGIPEHGNLGDHAITCGERAFFHKNFSKYPLLELSWEMANDNRAYLMDRIEKKDLICIQGGGFLGSLWENEQDQVNQVIERFHENTVLILPQTYWCEDDEAGQLTAERFGQAMSRCENICVCLREKESYERFKNCFPNIPVLMVPDMALYIQTKLKEQRENYALLCLRNDKERVVECEQGIKDCIAERGLQYKETSTVLDRQIPYGTEEKYVWDKLDEFAKAKLVVTDRLHGMIFAALMRTPCIAFNNISRKVEGVYRWIDQQANVCVIENENEIEAAEKYLSAKEEALILQIEKEYEKLVLYIQKMVEG